jgi:lipopolysaccharide export LptBFGC system permease protein LptF
MLADAGELIPELTETPTDLISEVRVWQHMSSSEMLDYLRKHPNISREAVADRKTDLHVRLAIPWACLLVTVFGIPVGAISSKQNVMAGIFIAVAFFLGFYLLLQMGIFWGKKQILFPWLGAWFSNIVSLAAGVVMIRRMR